MLQIHDDLRFRPTTVALPRDAANSIAKRSLDIIVATVALLALAPAALILALAIFVTSPGRVTFRQRRIGLHGKSFYIVKFRTMVADAEQRLHADSKLHAIYLENNHKVPVELDSRVTRLGRFLRASSLDEIPQFWNVLVGHMSLVGPRPVVPSELDRYGRHVAEYESVRPGLTGLWQASGRSNVPYAERVRMDVSYVRNWSLLSDLGIMLRTVPAVLKRHGAH